MPTLFVMWQTQNMHTKHKTETLNINCFVWMKCQIATRTKQAGTLLAVFSLLLHVRCCSQHTRELISARKPPHKHNNKDLSRLRYLWTRSVLFRFVLGLVLFQIVSIFAKAGPQINWKTTVFRFDISVDRASDAFSFRYFQKVTVEHCYLSKHPSCPF